MAIEKFDRVNGAAPDLDRAQKRIQEGTQTHAPPFEDGAEMELKLDSQHSKALAHRLGRKPQGYKILSDSGDGVATLNLTKSTDMHLHFNLQVPSGAPVTIRKYRIWVY